MKERIVIPVHNNEQAVDAWCLLRDVYKLNEISKEELTLPIKSPRVYFVSNGRIKWAHLGDYIEDTKKELEKQEFTDLPVQVYAWNDSATNAVKTKLYYVENKQEVAYKYICYNYAYANIMPVEEYEEKYGKDITMKEIENLLGHKIRKIR